MTRTEEPSVLELDIGKVASGGGCVARAPDGRVVFVRHALPGERVMAAVTASTTSFLRADAIEILQASPDRITPPCPHAGPGRCGGCDFQHATLSAQRQLKAQRVAEQLSHVTGASPDIVVEAVEGDRGGLEWRTRVGLAADTLGHLGFRRHRSHELELVETCPIACPGVMETGALATTWSGFTEIEIAVGPESGQSLITATAAVRATPHPEVQGGLVVNGRVRQQPGALHTKVDGAIFRVSAGVFWQVHVGAAQALSTVVRQQLAAQPGDHVIDLFAGAGLFSVLLARDVGPSGSVLAVERDRRACADAEFNGRGLPQLTVIKGSVTPPLVRSRADHADLIVLDPSREGAGTAVMEILAAQIGRLRRIVYVSCDPSSFARDADVLLRGGWAMTALRAFDIFPMTEHVELVATFEPSPREANGDVR